MKKGLEVLTIATLVIFGLFVNLKEVKAASATISIVTSSSKVVIGNTFKVTVKVSSASPLGAWEYTLNYDSSKVSLVKSDVSLHYASYGDGTSKSKSYEYTFKALKSGSASFSVSKSSVIDWNENAMSVTNGSRSVSIITQAELEASYSSNNNLSSLSVEGFNLTPIFEKDITAYEINMPSTVTKVKINATKADNTASIAGIGEFDVSEGLNTFEVNVTAQNGNVKTYKININVEDLNPIIVKIDDKEYVVIKRTDLVTCPSTYLETIIKINDTDIPACKNEVSKYTLVGLKNDSGNVKLFVYDNDSYISYKEFNLNAVIFSPLKTTKNLDGYKKVVININGEDVDAYSLLGSDFYVIYGKNIETGEVGFYTYDKKENTLARYYFDETELLKGDIKTYLLIIIIFGGSLLICIVLLIILTVKKNKKSLKKAKIDNKESEIIENTKKSKK